MVPNQEMYQETQLIVALNNQINKLELALIQERLEAIQAKQPYLKYLLSAYIGRINQEEHFEILKLHLLVWEYFNLKGCEPQKAISKDDFEMVYTRHASMVKYTDLEEEDVAAKVVMREMDLIQARALLTVIVFFLKVNPIFDKMDSQMSGIVFIDLKCSIECMEKVI